MGHEGYSFLFIRKLTTMQLTDWLPTTKKEVELRGWDTLDVILFSGDAYVDHPSFGAAGGSEKQDP